MIEREEILRSAFEAGGRVVDEEWADAHGFSASTPESFWSEASHERAFQRFLREWEGDAITDNTKANSEGVQDRVSHAEQQNLLPLCRCTLYQNPHMNGKFCPSEEDLVNA